MPRGLPLATLSRIVAIARLDWSDLVTVLPTVAEVTVLDLPTIRGVSRSPSTASREAASPAAGGARRSAIRRRSAWMDRRHMRAGFAWHLLAKGWDEGLVRDLLDYRRVEDLRKLVAVIVI